MAIELDSGNCKRSRELSRTDFFTAETAANSSSVNMNMSLRHSEGLSSSFLKNDFSDCTVGRLYKPVQKLATVYSQ